LAVDALGRLVYNPQRAEGDAVMAKARKEVELAVRFGNQPGALARVLEVIAKEGINLLAYCSYSERDQSVMLLVTDDPYRAKAALQEAGFECKANAVVLVSDTDRVGAAAQLGARLGGAGISILYSYASSAGRGDFCAVFKTMDDAAAIRVLERRGGAQAAA
jgi:hypothetical protein